MVARYTDLVPQMKERWMKKTTKTPNSTLETRIETDTQSPAKTIIYRNFRKRTSLYRCELEQLAEDGGDDGLSPVIRTLCMHTNGSELASEGNAR